MRYLCFLFLLCLSLISIASSIQISPTSITLTQQQPISILTVRNPGSDELLIQLNLFNWQQINGREKLTPSQDLWVTPPLFKLLPHKTQIVRFGLKQKTAPLMQKNYRLLLRQVPIEKKIKRGIHFLLQMSLPVWIQPKVIQAQWHWQARWLDHKHLEIQLQNRGNVTLFIDQWKISNPNGLIAKQKTFRYILSQQNDRWVVPIQRNRLPLDIQARINGQTRRSQLHVY